MSRNTIGVFAVCLLVAVFGATGAVAQAVIGSGKVVKEERPVKGITSVVLSTPGELFIEIGDKERLVIEADRNILEHIETKVDGERLRIENPDWKVSLRPKTLRYYLTVKKLEWVRTTSDGSIEARKLKTDHFTAHITSSGDIRIDELHANTLEVNISSAGNLKIGGGRVEEQTIRLSSSGSYRARGLESKRATARLSSSGDATINVSDEIDAHVSSAGSLRYIGNPEVRAETTSSGTVTRIKD
jgi:hypothetical protein